MFYCTNQWPFQTSEIATRRASRPNCLHWRGFRTTYIPSECRSDAIEFVRLEHSLGTFGEFAPRRSVFDNIIFARQWSFYGCWLLASFFCVRGPAYKWRKYGRRARYGFSENGPPFGVWPARRMTKSPSPDEEDEIICTKRGNRNPRLQCNNIVVLSCSLLDSGKI